MLVFEDKSVANFAIKAEGFSANQWSFERFQA
jgi:hypothetical protein